MNKLPKQLWDAIQTRTKGPLGEDFWKDISEVLPAQGPRIDVYETKQSVVVVAEFPGVEDSGQIKLSLSNHTLHMWGEIASNYMEHEEDMLESERFIGQFDRRIVLPEAIDDNRIHAQLKNGLLTVIISKNFNKPITKNINIKFDS